MIQAGAHVDLGCFKRIMQYQDYLFVNEAIKLCVGSGGYDLNRKYDGGAGPLSFLKVNTSKDFQWVSERKVKVQICLLLNGLRL